MSFLDNVAQVSLSRMPESVKTAIENDNQFFYIDVKRRKVTTNLSLTDVKKLKTHTRKKKFFIVIKGHKLYSTYKQFSSITSSMIISLVIQSFIHTKLKGINYTLDSNGLKLYPQTNIGGYFYSCRFAASAPFIRGEKVINPGNVYKRGMGMVYFLKAMDDLKRHMTDAQKRVDGYNRQLEKLLKMLPTKQEYGKTIPKFELQQIRGERIEVDYYKDDDLPF